MQLFYNFQAMTSRFNGSSNLVKIKECEIKGNISQASVLNDLQKPKPQTSPAGNEKSKGNPSNSELWKQQP